MTVSVAGGSQGAGEQHVSDGQTSGKGAPVAPVVINNPNGSGDTVVPKENAAPAVEAPKVETPPVVKDDTILPDGTTEAKTGDEPPLVAQWAEWEDPNAAAAQELLKEAGVSPAEADAIFAKALASGDTRDIDVKALEAKVGKAKALLIMNGVTAYHRDTNTKNTETVNAVKEVFGGDAGWNTVRDWAQTKEKIDPAFKKELDGIREDLNRGGRAARAAAGDLLKLYNGSPSTKGLGNTTLVKGDGRAVPVGQPLTRADYLVELKKAHAAGAGGAAIAQLDARRLAGRKAGL